MTQNERVKEVRKTLGLTLEKFGERIGVTRGSMSNIENGNRNLTEQMTKSICREFSVDYIWLTTGDGEMFVDTDDDFKVFLNNFNLSFMSYSPPVRRI